MIKITINLPITHVELSKKRKAKYYKQGVKIPKRFTKEKGYYFGPDKILRDSEGNKVIANPRSVGKPRLWKINGQALYSGNLHPLARKKITPYMKKYLGTYLDRVQTIIDYPIQIRAIRHEVPGTMRWDIDNQNWIWMKWFQDALVDKGIIPDDNVEYIRRTGDTEVIFVDSEEDRKLTFIIQPYEQSI